MESDQQLLSALGKYGYLLFEPEQMPEPNPLLARLSESGDARLLEGFPVVLATALDRKRDSFDPAVVERHLKDTPARDRFRRLVALSYYVFGLYGVQDLLPARFELFLRSQPDLFTKLKRSLERNEPLSLGNVHLDLDRVKRTFLNYYLRSKEVESAERKTQLREEFRREFYLSVFFAPKQRDLLQKKLKGEPLTKTEREYFSRVVRKKLLALADPDLHRLAQKALQ